MSESADQPPAEAADQPRTEAADQPRTEAADQPRTEAADQAPTEAAGQAAADGADKSLAGAVEGPVGAPADRPQPRNPLHGITLEMIVNQLVERFGWQEMGRKIPIRCFLNNPSVKSSLTFLRKTPWARQKVEGWFLYEQRKSAKKR